MGAHTQRLSDLVSSTTNAFKTPQQQAVGHFQESFRDDGADWPRRIQRELRVMKLDENTEEHQLALSSLQSMLISENVLGIETKPSTAMAKNREKFSLSLQEFSGNAKASNEHKQPSHELVPTQFSSKEKPIDSWAPSFHLIRPGLQKIVGTLSIYHFPIGFLHIKEMKKRTTYNDSTSARNDWSYAIEFSLFPSSWIANRIIQLSLAMHGGQNRAPSIDFALKQACYNNIPSLINCVRSGDIPGLQKLFGDGEARPTDVVGRWGDSLLHVHTPNHSISERSHHLRLIPSSRFIIMCLGSPAHWRSVASFSNRE